MSVAAEAVAVALTAAPLWEATKVIWVSGPTTVTVPTTVNRGGGPSVIVPRDVALGLNAGLMYTVNGDIMGWGVNSSGHIGIGAFTPLVAQPTPVVFREDP